MKITENELLDALRAAQRKSPDGPNGALTAHEMATALDCSHHSVMAYLRQFKMAGRLEAVRVLREGIDGRVSPVTAYRVRKAGKKAVV